MGAIIYSVRTTLSYRKSALKTNVTHQWTIIVIIIFYLKTIKEKKILNSCCLISCLGSKYLSTSACIILCLHKKKTNWKIIFLCPPPKKKNWFCSPALPPGACAAPAPVLVLTKCQIFGCTPRKGANIL